MTDTTNAHSEPNQPAGLGCNEGLGPAAWWARADNGNIRAWTSAQAEALRLAEEVGFALEALYTQSQLDAAVAAERERWRATIEDAAHQLEKARIWGGMEWHYNPLHPMHYLPALKRLRDALGPNSKLTG